MCVLKKRCVSRAFHFYLGMALPTQQLKKRGPALLISRLIVKESVIGWLGRTIEQSATQQTIELARGGYLFSGAVFFWGGRRNGPVKGLVKVVSHKLQHVQ